ncbi:hypothetical protein K488DRAFT_51169 [Vararia minispora EC-137]|uniref:Uncharacterized protein n=1 Tax=Vararia minispora EC-137 TaxID=1314806 RepID=A0ACB8QJP8_9AGAM|nr:hypothetical protein K488DRAFT_51169 [Vararia minispora EC-137]
MAFRLPSTHLESLLPLSMAQDLQHRPWSGSLSLTFVHTAQGGPQNVFVTIADVDRQACSEFWPPSFNIQVAQNQIAAAEVAAWVRHHSPPICVFMPNKHPENSVNSANRSAFASLARYLRLHNLVAYGAWDRPDRFPNGGGIVIYPSTSTTEQLLLGAIFPSAPLPEFVVPSQTSPTVASVSPQAPQAQYQPLGPDQPSSATSYYPYAGQYAHS